VPSSVETKTADDEVSNPSGRRLWNGALDIAQRCVACALGNDRTALLACFSSDFRGVHHGVLAADFGWPPYGSAEEFADFLLWLLDHSESRQFTIHPLAIRGDRLAMYRSTTGSDAGVIDRLVVARGTDSAVIETHFFDPDQLFDAIDELDRLWIEHDPSAVLRVAQLPGTRLGAALAAGNPDAIRSAVTDDFAALDHRQIGLGERHVDDWIESMTATATGGAFVTIPATVLMGDEHHVLSLLAVSLGDDTWHVLTITEVRDGLVSRIEHFDGDDLDAATARYRDLERQEERGHFTNTAWELGLLADATLRQGDREGAKELFASEFVGVWHHRAADGGVVETTRDDYLAVSAEIGMADIHDRTTELLAIRGDRLALVRATNVYAAARTVAYVILESDDHQLTRLDRFDEDQRTEAIEEFDRRWLADSGVPSDAFIVAVWPSANTLQADDLSDIVHPDFEFTDHRSLRNDTDGVSFDEFARRGWTEDDTWALVTEVHRFDESGTVYTRVERNGDDEIWIVFVAEQADGALRRLDLFDPDHLIDALALFDRHTSGPRSPDRVNVATNRAFRIADGFGRAVIDGDRDLMLSLLTDDFEIDHQGSARVALGLETRAQGAEFVDLMLTTATQEGAESLTRTLLASRGDGLYLAASTLTTADGDELLNYALGEADGSRLRRMTYYDEFQLDEALDDLDRRYRLSCGIGDDHWLAENWSALTSPDAEVYEALLADDFRGIEHRPVRLGETDRSVLIAYVRATPPTTAWSIPVVHRLSDRGMVFEQLETWGDGAGDTRVVMTIEFGDGVIKRLDAYEPDDLDAALARYDEIIGVVRRTLTNGAWDSVRRRQRALDELDVDGYASMFDESFVAEFHDLLMSAIPGTAIFDKTGFLELILHQDMTHDGARSEMELIAVRGEDLCLYLVGMINADGDLTQRLAVDETCAGLCTRMAIFGPDQFGDALAELDRRYRLSCGIGEDHWIAENWSVLYASDFADLQPVLHPQFEYVERRRLGWPNGDADDWREWFTPNTSAQETMIPAMYRLCEHGVVTRRSERFEAGDLGVSESILVNEAEDGRVRRVVSYEPDDLDRALAEFDAFVAASGPSRVLTNESWELVKRIETIRRRDDRDGYGSLLADDIVVITYDPIMAAIDNDRGAYDKERYLDALFDPLLPTSATDLDLIAVRGDELCLVRTRTTTPEGDVHERLLVVEVHDGLCVRIDVYRHDQLAEAQIALDHAWLNSLGFAHDHPWFELTGLFYRSDPTVLAHAFSEEFRYVEHRQLSFPDGDRSQLLVNANTQLSALEVVIPRYLRLTERLALGERIEQTVGGAAQMPGLYLTALGDDGRIAYMEVFDVDDEEAAIASFERLLARERSEGSVLGPFTNAAWALVQQAQLVKVNDGNRDRFASFFADDFVATTHDSIMAHANDGIFDKAQYMEATFDPVFGPDSTQHIQLIAVRGDDRCLFRSRVTTPDDDLHERLNVLEVRDGLAVRIDVFRHDQLGKAQTTLDRRWLTSLDFADDHPWLAVLDWFYESDPTVMARELPDDFRSVDHRRLTYPDGDRSQMITNVNTRLGAVEMVVPRYFRVTDRMAFFEHIEQTVGGSEQSLSLMVSKLGPDGRVVHLEIFEVDDEDGAIACFDRLLADGASEAPGLGPLTNAAWDVVGATPALDDATGHHELIAVRADRFCLTRFTGTDPKGRAVDRLVVSDVVHGRVERSTTFEPDDLVAALRELDDEYAADMDEPEFMNWTRRMADAFDHGSFEDLRALVTDDFQSIDHRSLGLGPRTADEWATSIAPLVGHHRPVTTRIVRHDDSLWLSEARPQFLLDGSEWHMMVLIRRVGHRIDCWDVFDPEQLGQALARFDELANGTRSSPALTNRAAEITSAFNAAYVAGDRVAIDRLVDLDGPVEYRQRFSVIASDTARSFVEFVLASHAEAAANRQRVGIIAVRGEHLCLVVVDGWYDDDNLKHCLVAETDDERISHMVWFDDDQLIEAQLELDRRWLASTGQADHWFEPHWPLLYDPHPDAMFDFLAPDFEYIEHRPLMYPSGDAELMRTTIASMEHEAVFTIPRIHRMSDAGGVFERVETAVGEFGQTHVVFVTRFVDQLVRSIEAFDITQLDEALARYDEFTSD
jgi:hypothetical protein